MKLNLTLLFGGQSTEHEVSISSARNVFQALDPEKYQVDSIYITEAGEWHYLVDDQWLSQSPQHSLNQLRSQRVLIAPGELEQGWVLNDLQTKIKVDCIIPMLHGTLGEDGALQGLFEMLNLAYVGSNILGSAICMNKHVTKQLLKAQGVATANWKVLTVEERSQINFDLIKRELGPSLFIKPANLGSSVGMTKVNNSESFNLAIDEAFKYSDMILIEEYVKGREIECAVLGNEIISCTVPGEIIPHEDFYTYSAKYLEPEGKGATLNAPADLDPDLIAQFKLIALKAYKILGCAGLARIDFFLTDQLKILVNEINTIPGFTNISMYPRVWQLEGLNYPQLIDELISLAIQKHRQKQSIIRIYRHKKKQEEKKPLFNSPSNH